MLDFLDTSRTFKLKILHVMVMTSVVWLICFHCTELKTTVRSRCDPECGSLYLQLKQQQKYLSNGIWS